MADRTPKVGEVWKSQRDLPYECVVDKPDQTGFYVWKSYTGSFIVTTAANLTPPIKSPPSWIDDDCWVIFTDPDCEKMRSDLYQGSYKPAGAAARVKVDPKTFEWLT